MYDSAVAAGGVYHRPVAHGYSHVAAEYDYVAPLQGGWEYDLEYSPIRCASREEVRYFWFTPACLRHQYQSPAVELIRPLAAL